MHIGIWFICCASNGDKFRACINDWIIRNDPTIVMSGSVPSFRIQYLYR
jgi:hypothetical protein